MLDSEDCENISILSYDIMGLEGVVILRADLFRSEFSVFRDSFKAHILDDHVGLGVSEGEEAG